MATWGTHTLNILFGTPRGPSVDANINSIRLIPPDSTTDHAEVLQQGGRARKRISFTGRFASLTDYESLHADYIAATAANLNISGVATDFYSVIAELSEPMHRHKDFIEYTITLAEEDV